MVHESRSRRARAGSLFDTAFFTHKYPRFICTKFNDLLVVLKEPRAPQTLDANVLFDTNGDPVSVNTALLTTCDPTRQDATALKLLSCERGIGLLEGTGFGPGDPLCGETTLPPNGFVTGASTGWPYTTVPVTKGEVVVLRFALWDTGDSDVDSTALIDNFRWSVEQPELRTVPAVVLF